MRLTILGDSCPKKNLYRIAKGHFYKDAKVTAYEKSFFVQARQQLGASFQTLTKPLSLQATFYIKRDADLDNLQGGLFDALQAARIIENDRLIRHIDAFKEKDAKKPRVDITLEAFE